MKEVEDIIQLPIELFFSLNTRDYQHSLAIKFVFT